MLNVRDLVNWGIEGGHTTPEDIRLSIADRKAAAIKLVEGGMSQRQAAKLLGVSQMTIMRDVKQNVSKSETKSDTDSPDTKAGKTSKSKTGKPETKARREEIAAEAASQGVTPAPIEKYRIIYADPPWDYGAHAQPDYHKEQRDHYPIMELEKICAEPVKDWVQDNAVLFLWVTSPILEKAFQVIHAWGFEYKASFVWDKIKHNMGHYNSVRHEFLLICARGSCQPDAKQLFDSVQSIERGEHSAKPVEFYDIIETLYTYGKRLEMYARQRRPGWDAYAHIQQLEAAE